MASAFSHIAVPVALGMAAGRKKISWRLLILGLLLSAAPDLDSIGYHYGVPYPSQWGHRGFTHSIAFALFVSVLLIPFSRFLRSNSKTVFLVSFISMVSHGILDAFTNGGLGIAFFWPFTSQRYFFPWQVIQVSPISITRFFTQRGIDVFQSELFYIWLPCLLFGVGFYLLRHFCLQKTKN